MPGSEEKDDSLEELLMIKVLVVVGLPAALVFLSRRWESAQDWALEHRVVLPADAALWVIPSTQVGLDLARTVVAALAGAAVAVMAAAFVNSARRRRAQRTLESVARGQR